jgi:PAB1-binding protein PBP1
VCRKEKKIFLIDRWEIDGPSGKDSNLSLEDSKPPKGKDTWDQFKVNNEMFGIKFTYHDDHYTTKLDINSVDQELRKKAERLEAVRNII